MHVQAVIDRFEASKAVLLVGDHEMQVIWPKAILPTGVREGDILQIDVRIDEKATIAAKMESESLLQKIIDNNGEGK